MIEAGQTLRGCCQCGTALPPDAPQGLCPACLLERVCNEAPAELQPAAFESACAEKPGETIGRYKLLEQIGEGGFGVVYMAEQVEPVQRKVALKIVKAGMDTREVIARFEAERQALALMDHPNIAHVFDGGVTQAGRPYFVMELVRGVPITIYCDQRNLSTDQRLRLFSHVCQAVQHAHQKGIIHRDLKPSNILVTHQESELLPKVIDFGIAKALGQKLTDRTLFTGFLRMVGTPAYMSPEQAEFTGVDIDTRSDIYALGVLLYELLTGVTPFDAETLRDVALDEVRRMIRETDPAKPSTRLTDLVAADIRRLKSSSEPDRASSRRLLQEKTERIRRLRGDLDWIVMKCLEKDRRRRYETANGLAMDVLRHLKHEPVVARPPTTVYRLKKFVRRRKLVVAAGAAIATSVILVLVGALVYALQQRELAVGRTQLAQDRERARLDSESKLYRALLGQADALRGARAPGYRSQVWKLLKQASALDVPDKRPEEIRQQVLACLGDPIGLDPIPSPDVERVRPPEVPEDFMSIVSQNLGRLSAVSPDGQWLAFVARSQKEVALWARTGQVATVTSSLGIFNYSGLKFTPDGRWLAAGCENGTLVWSVPDLSLRASFRGDSVHDFAVHPDDDRIATLSNLGRRIELRSLTSSRQIASFRSPQAVEKVEFSAGGKYLLGLSSDRKRVIAGWAMDRTPEKRYLEGHRQGVTALEFSPEGRALASSSHDRTVCLWDVESGDLRYALRGHEAEVQSLAFSPDGKRLASGDWAGTIRVWDLESRTELASAKRPAAGWVWCLQFDSAGRYLAAGGDGEVSCLELKPTASGLEVIPFWETSLGRVDLAIHPSGSHLALAVRGRASLFWCDLTQGGIPKLLDVQARWQLFALHFDLTGKRLRFLTSKNTIATWDIEKSAVVTEAGVEVPDLGPAITLDGRWAAIPNRDQGMTLYDLEQDQELFTLPPEGGQVWSHDFSPDNRLLAVGLSSGGLAIWSLEDVRAQLGEFGIPTPSTEVQVDSLVRHEPLSDAAFDAMVETNRAISTAARSHAINASRIDELIAEAERAIQRNPDDPEAHLKLGIALGQKGLLDEAISGYKEAIRLDPERHTPHCRLGEVLLRKGLLDEAIAACKEAIRLDPVCSTAHHILGHVFENKGLLDEAIAELGESLALTKKRLGEEPSRVAEDLACLARVLTSQGKHAQAEALSRELLALSRKVFGNEHRAVEVSLGRLADALGKQGKLAEAEAVWREELALERKLSGEEHPFVVNSLIVLADVLEAQGKLPEAEALFGEALAMYKTLLANDHPDVDSSLNYLVSTLERQAKHAEAEVLRREALEHARKHHAD